MPNTINMLKIGQQTTNYLVSASNNPSAKCEYECMWDIYPNYCVIRKKDTNEYAFGVILHHQTRKWTTYDVVVISPTCKDIQTNTLIEGHYVTLSLEGNISKYYIAMHYEEIANMSQAQLKNVYDNDRYDPLFDLYQVQGGMREDGGYMNYLPTIEDPKNDLWSLYPLYPTNSKEVCNIPGGFDVTNQYSGTCIYEVSPHNRTSEGVHLYDDTYNPIMEDTFVEVDRSFILTGLSYKHMTDLYDFKLRHIFHGDKIYYAHKGQVFIRTSKEILIYDISHTYNSDVSFTFRCLFRVTPRMNNDLYEHIFYVNQNIVYTSRGNMDEWATLYTDKSKGVLDKDGFVQIA